MQRVHIKRLSILLPMIDLLAGCSVPSDIASKCRQEAVGEGFGKCSISKGRQNAYGVWIVKLDCTRGVASCTSGSSDRVSVSEWISMDEYLFQKD